jgi:hypothetical protein
LIKQPQNYESAKITVYLKNGTVYEHKDITGSPLGETERLLSFWEEDGNLLVVPMEQVHYFIMHFEQD